MSKPALVSRIAVCVILCRKRTPELTITAERWFLSVRYRKAVTTLAGGWRGPDAHRRAAPAGYAVAFSAHDAGLLADAIRDRHPPPLARRTMQWTCRRAVRGLRDNPAIGPVPKRD
jgi:hypothetical protein